MIGKSSIWIWLWIGFIIAAAHPARADVLMLKEDSAPIHGFVESDNESNVVFLVYDESDQSFSRREFAHRDVDQLIRTVDRQRLEKLSIDRLSDYRDLAEELSSLGSDPVAKLISLRLTLLCLHHADDTEAGTLLRRSAAANLLTLARNDQQRERFHMIAFLAGLDIASGQLDADTQGPDRESLDQSVLRIAGAVRRQQFDLASRLLDSPSGTAALAQWPASMDPLRLKVAIQQKALGTELLGDLLAIEIRIRYGNGPSGEKPTVGSNQFADTHRLRSNGAIGFPQLQAIANFDLEESEFRRGQWTRPD